MSREDFEGIRRHAKENHDRRVADTPRRVQYAIEQFEKYGIEYELKNPQTGHFHCRRKSDGLLFQFYAGTGTIQGLASTRGIRNLIRALTEKGNNKK